MGGALPLLVMASVHVPHAVQNKGGVSRPRFCLSVWLEGFSRFVWLTNKSFQRGM